MTKSGPIVTGLLVTTVVLGGSVVAPDARPVGSERDANVSAHRRPDVLLRTHPQAWAIGTHFAGDRFDPQCVLRGYALGYAGGKFNGRAWVLARPIPGARNAPRCRREFRIPLRASAHAPAKGYPCSVFECQRDERGRLKRRLTYPSKVNETCRRAGIFGNYRRGRHFDRHRLLSSKTPIGWRYTTGDGRSAMVRYHRGNIWGFVRKACVVRREERPGVIGP